MVDHSAPGNDVSSVASGLVPDGLLVALSGLGLVVSGSVAGQPPLTFLGLVAGVVAVLGNWLHLDIAIPAAAASLYVAAGGVALTAGALGVDLLSPPWLPAVAHGLVSVACLAAATRTRSRNRLTTPPPGFSWPLAVAYVPAGLALLVGLLQLLVPRLPIRWAFAATDIAGNVAILTAVQREGSLTYVGAPYPKGNQALVTFLSHPSLPVDDAEALVLEGVSTYTALIFFGFALLIWTVVALMTRAGAALALPRRSTSSSAMAVGAALLAWPDWSSVFLFNGSFGLFASLGSMLLIPLAALASRGGPRYAPVLLAATLSVLVLVQSWQALVLGPVCALGFALSNRRVWGSVGHVRQLAARRRILWIGAGAAAAALIATAPLISVVAEGGLRLAAIRGNIVGVPAWVLAGSVVAALWTARYWRLGWVRLYTGLWVGLALAVLALTKGAGNGWDFAQWYPMKGLWFLTGVLLPIAFLWAGRLVAASWMAVWHILSRTGKAVRVLRASLSATALMLAAALLLPWVLASPPASLRIGLGWTTYEASERRWDIARRYRLQAAPGAAAPIETGWYFADGLSTGVVIRLLAALTGQPWTSGSIHRVCADIELLKGSGDVLVVTALRPSLVHEFMARQGCEVGTRVENVFDAGIGPEPQYQNMLPFDPGSSAGQSTTRPGTP